MRKAVVGGHARNVILLIGDGMGDSEITSARNYAKGAAGRFAGIDALPLTGQYTTYSLDEGDRPARTTCPTRRPPASAWSTGPRPTTTRSRSTSTARRSRRCSSWPRPTGSRPATSRPPRSRTRPRPSRSRTSRRAPATARPDDDDLPGGGLENGGLGSITEQLLDTRPDVTLGGGSATFAADGEGRRVGGQDAHPAGPGARLPARRRRGRARGRHAGRPAQAAARPLRARQPAGALGRAGGDGRRRRSCPA